MQMNELQKDVLNVSKIKHLFSRFFNCIKLFSCSILTTITKFPMFISI